MPLLHTMLLALMAQYCMHGEDSFHILRTTRPVVVKDDDKNTKAFKYKHQVLLALYDEVTRRLMVSMLAVYRRCRIHHANVTDDATNPVAGLKYLQGWASSEAWFREMVQPTARDSLRSLATWRKLGIARSMSTGEAPLLDGALAKVFAPRNVRGYRPGARLGLWPAHPLARNTARLGYRHSSYVHLLEADLSEDETIIVHHVRQTLACVRQMFRYTIQPRAPPWVFCLFVNEDLTADKIAYVRALSDFVWKLFTSQDCPPAAPLF